MALAWGAAHWALVLSGCWTIGVVVATLTPLGTYIDPLQFHFKVREALGRDPSLDPRLKILSMDDGSVDRLQRPDLTIADWATLLEHLATAQPRVIIIDKIFALLNDPQGSRSNALRRIAAIKVPVYVGAYAAEQTIRSRPLLDLSAPRYRANNYSSAGGTQLSAFEAFRGFRVYGPHPEFGAVISGAGHINYFETGAVPLMISPSPGAVLPHLALAAAKNLPAIDGRRLYIDGLQVNADRDSRTIVNFSRLDAYYQRHTRLGSALERALQNVPPEGINTGDVVVVLPEMYTGSTDFKPTPIGLMPGGFILVALINSVLTGRWIEPAPVALLQLLFCAAFGTYWGYRRRPWLFWTGVLAWASLLAAAETWCFSFADVAIATPHHLGAFLGAAFAAFAGRNLQREKEARRIAAELTDAAEMAKTFLPDPPPEWPGLRIAALHRSISHGSGDWYAFRASPSGRFRHFVLIDVTGHGVQAALMVAVCKTTLALVDQEGALDLESKDFVADYARLLNAMLCQLGNGRYIVTLAGLTFDTVRHEVRFLTAGHPSPLWSGGERGELRQLSMRASPLGFVPGLELTMNRIVPSRGDEIIAYTDGLPVRPNLRLLRTYLAGSPPAFERGPEALLNGVWRAEAVRVGERLSDDVSIVWFKLVDWGGSSHRDDRRGRAGGGDRR